MVSFMTVFSLFCEEIHTAKYFGLPGEQCKAKWENIKDYFSTIRKKIKESRRSGSGGKVINKGPFYDRLQFLLGHMPEGRYFRESNTLSRHI